MKLIVDTNIILSSLIKEGLNRRIIVTDSLRFYTLNYVIMETRKYMDYIIEKSGITKNEAEILLSLFMENITILSDEEIRSKISEAKEIMKNIDINDAPILACALAIRNDGIWTEDRHFEKQRKVRIWHSKDLLAYV
tara:strand:+ start:3543 stop:3953 length:411 start_codon:yes stop_codon:yes gene_type:complete